MVHAALGYLPAGLEHSRAIVVLQKPQPSAEQPTLEWVLLRDGVSLAAFSQVELHL